MSVTTLSSLHQQRGFTLFELLIALAVLSVVTAIVMPQFQIGPSTVASGTAHSIAAHLRRARELSMRESRAVEVAVDLDERVVRSDLGTVNLSETLDYTLFLAGPTKSGPAPGRAGVVTFFADGSATGGRITVSPKGITYRIDVNWLTGAVAVGDETL
jgi:general secretion pathway protein H